MDGTARTPPRQPESTSCLCLWPASAGFIPLSISRAPRQAIGCYEGAVDALERLLSSGHFSDDRRSLVQQQRQQMARECAWAMQVLKEDPYTALGLETSCSAALVKKAYRQMALKFHPGKAGGGGVGGWWGEAG